MSEPKKTPEALKLFPEKLFYKIGEVSKIVDVEPYVLRYWETEFPFLVPRKSKSGQRIYSKKDIDLILDIKKLLYEEKFTIDGARRKIMNNPSSTQGVIETEIDKGNEIKKIEKNDKEVLHMIKKRLREILNNF